jgi:hypothetical protein
MKTNLNKCNKVLKKPDYREVFSEKCSYGFFFYLRVKKYIRGEERKDRKQK